MFCQTSSPYPIIVMLGPLNSRRGSCGAVALMNASMASISSGRGDFAMSSSMVSAATFIHPQYGRPRPLTCLRAVALEAWGTPTEEARCRQS